MLASRAQNLLGSRQLFWLSIFVTFVFFAPYHHKLNNPNEGVRIFMVKAMVDHGQFHIDPVVKKWKYINDKSKRDGKLYSSKAPLMSMMGLRLMAFIAFGARPWMNERLPCFVAFGPTPSPACSCCFCSAGSWIEPPTTGGSTISSS